MPSEDRIRDLCQRVIAESDEPTLRLLVAELQSALKEFIDATRSHATGAISQIKALEAKNGSKLNVQSKSSKQRVA